MSGVPEIKENESSLASKTPAKIELTLHQAAEAGDLEMVKKRLAEGVAVNQPDKKGKTALHYAAGAGRVGVVNHLIDEAKADVTIVDKDNHRLALHDAAQGGHPKVIRQLIFANSKVVDQKDKNGNTPLILAVQSQKQGAVQALMFFKPDITIQDDEGFTALHYAAGQGSVDVLGDLMHGQDESVLQIKARDGEMPLHSAIENDSAIAVQWLWRKDSSVFQKADFFVEDRVSYSFFEYCVLRSSYEAIKYLKSVEFITKQDFEDFKKTKKKVFRSDKEDRRLNKIFIKLKFEDATSSISSDVSKPTTTSDKISENDAEFEDSDDLEAGSEGDLMDGEGDLSEQDENDDSINNNEQQGITFVASSSCKPAIEEPKPPTDEKPKASWADSVLTSKDWLDCKDNPLNLLSMINRGFLDQIDMGRDENLVKEIKDVVNKIDLLFHMSVEEDEKMPPPAANHIQAIRVLFFNDHRLVKNFRAFLLLGLFEKIFPNVGEGLIKDNDYCSLLINRLGRLEKSMMGPRNIRIFCDLLLAFAVDVKCAKSQCDIEKVFNDFAASGEIRILELMQSEVNKPVTIKLRDVQQQVSNFRWWILKGNPKEKWHKLPGMFIRPLA